MDGSARAGASLRRSRGFTLMELMVVVGIIVIMTALAIPSISKFLDGQSLVQSSRIMQSAFNEARRAAITQRAKNYLVFFRQDDPSRPGEYLYGVRRFRERVGYEGEPQFLVAGTQLELADSGGSTTTSLPSGIVLAGWTRGANRGVGSAGGLPVFDGLPPEDNEDVFGPTKWPTDNVFTWVEFQRDGTIKKLGTLEDRVPPDVGGANLFDLNSVIDAPWDTFKDLPDKVDLNIRDVGTHDVEKRSFLDIDYNTGRVSIRVLEAAPDAPTP